jgi:diguanylate cyclase (GGDEF)-like protein
MSDQPATIDTRDSRRKGFRVPIAWKFFLLLVVVVPSLIAVSFVGARGMHTMKGRFDSVYQDSVASIELVAHLSVAVEDAEQLSLRLIDETDLGDIADIRSDLHDQVFPDVDRGLAGLRSVGTSASIPFNTHLDRQAEAAWREFVAFTNTPEFIAASSGRAEGDGAASSTVERLGRALDAIVEGIDARELGEAHDARNDAERTYARNLRLLWAIVGLGLLLGVGVTVWLIRSVVVRVREYSGFSARVAAGELNTRTRPRGRDELTELGWALNDMVAQGEAARSYEEGQGEFTEALQVTEAEDEAHGLLKRHLERSIPGSRVVVLNRNNSADRLEATTELPPDSELGGRLAEAKPRDCMAVRLARQHQESPGAERLISCGLCGHLDAPTTCKPLLVGGEVIGSVLVKHGESLGEEDLAHVRDSVDQAAPVLANLRNLAIAQVRAATDSLSGLPNARAVQDTLKRLVAQASRMFWPLSAVLLDLDHFKQINDTLGHPKGDEVLAAVGVALEATVRDADFVGRYGGEEFVVLMPDTGRQDAVLVSERIRAAIAGIEVLDGDRNVTASFGVAVFPDDAPDAGSLIRCADRALYQAKANGRDRVEVFTLDGAGNGESGGPGDGRTPREPGPSAAKRRHAPSARTDTA